MVFYQKSLTLQPQKNPALGIPPPKDGTFLVTVQIKCPCEPVRAKQSAKRREFGEAKRGDLNRLPRPRHEAWRVLAMTGDFHVSDNYARRGFLFNLDMSERFYK